MDLVKRSKKWKRINISIYKPEICQNTRGYFIPPNKKNYPIYVGSTKFPTELGKMKKAEEKQRNFTGSTEVGSEKSVKGPKIVKTTTKQLMVKDKEGITENFEEKIEDLASGEVQVSTHINKVMTVIL